MSARLSAGVAAALGAAVITVAGCSSAPSGDAPAAQAPPTGGAQESAGSAAPACTLLTADEVSAALGTPVGDGAKPEGSDPMGRRNLCQWRSTAGPNLVVRVLPSGLSFTDYRNEFKGSQPVEGVGDEAFYSNSALTMRVGDAVIEFTAVGMPRGKELTFYKDVAGKAAARA